MALYFCTVEDEHEGHRILVHKRKSCSGRTTCGAKDHEPHDYDAAEMEWCPGVCSCGIIKSKHGQGEHK